MRECFSFNGIELSKYLSGINRFFDIQNINIEIKQNKMIIYAFNDISSLKVDFNINYDGDRVFYFNINNRVFYSFIFNKDNIKAVFENNVLKLISNNNRAAIDCFTFEQESINESYYTTESVSDDIKDFLFSNLSFVSFSGKLFRPEDTFIKFRIKDNIVRLLFVEFFCSAESSYVSKLPKDDAYFSLPVSTYDTIKYFFSKSENLKMSIDESSVIFKDNICSVRLNKAADKYSSNIFDLYDEDIIKEKNKDLLGSIEINPSTFFKEDLKDLAIFSSSATLDNKISLIKLKDKDFLMCEVLNSFGKSQKLLDTDIKICKIIDEFKFTCNLEAFKIAMYNISHYKIAKIDIYKNRLYINSTINNINIQYQLAEVND